jgi:hypothetical protein
MQGEEKSDGSSTCCPPNRQQLTFPVEPDEALEVVDQICHADFGGGPGNAGGANE